MDDQNNLANNSQNPINPQDLSQNDQKPQIVEEKNLQNNQNSGENVSTFAQIDSSTPPPPPIPGATEDKNDKEENKGSSAPNLDIPPVITIDKPKRKFGGKTIATILGILVLVGGIGAGVILVKQQQDIREKAKEPTPCKICSNGKCISSGAANCDSRWNECSVDINCGGSTSTPTPSSGCSSGSTCRYGLTDCGVYNEVKTGTCSGGVCCAAATPTPNLCETNGGKCYSSDNLPTCSNLVSLSQYNSSCSSGRVCLKCAASTTPSCIPDGQCMTSSTACCNGYYADTTCGYSIPIRCGANGGGGGGGTSTPNPTPTPTSVVQCGSIKAYDTNWNEFSSTNLKNLSSGDIVRFTIAGTATSGTFDKAKFTVNSVSLGETTSKKPNSEEFYTQYTIPSGITNFTINAQIHHTVKGWI